MSNRIDHWLKHYNRKFNKKVGLGLSMILLVLTMIACQFTTEPRAGNVVVNPQNFGAAITGDKNSNVSIIMVQHALCSWDSYWCIVQQGIEDAAHDLKVNVTIVGPQKFNLPEVAALIEKAAAAKPNGLGVTISDPVLFKAPLTALIDADIPVIAYDTGKGPRADGIPYLAYIGMDYGGPTGSVVGLRLAAKGGTRALCLNHQVGVQSLDAACQSFIKVMEKNGIDAEVLGITEDSAKSQAIISDYYKAHPELDIVFTTGTLGAQIFYKFVEAAKIKPGLISHGTNDISPEIAAKIKEGITLFAVDGQAYLQGYMTVQWLTWINRYEFKPATEILYTGPTFVDARNVERVEKLLGKYR